MVYLLPASASEKLETVVFPTRLSDLPATLLATTMPVLLFGHLSVFTFIFQCHAPMRGAA
jgi:hypothetical protein